MIMILPDSCVKPLSREADLVSWHLTSISLKVVKHFQAVPKSSICQTLCAYVTLASYLTAVHSPGCNESENLVQFLSSSCL